MEKILKVSDIQKKFAEFAAAREWDQFHSPKNLAMALSVEVSEFVEIFQWLKEEESRDLESLKADTKKYQGIKDELADIMLYSLRLADILDVDLETAIEEKMQQNAAKYPVDKSRGNATKYTDL